MHTFNGLSSPVKRECNYTKKQLNYDHHNELSDQVQTYSILTSQSYSELVAEKLSI